MPSSRDLKLFAKSLANVFEYLDQVSEMLMIVEGVGGKILHANSALRHAIGRTDSHIRVGTFFLNLLPGEHIASARTWFEKAVSSGQDSLHSTIIAMASGEIRSVVLEISPLSFGEDDLYQIRVFERDQDSSSDPLGSGETHQFLQYLVESSHMAIITYGNNGQPQTWNPEAERIFGFTRQEILSGPPWPGERFLVTREGAVGQIAQIESAMERCKGGQQGELIQTRRCHRDGRTLVLSSVFSPINDAGGNLVGIAELLQENAYLASGAPASPFLKEFNRVILENVKLGMAVFDLEGLLLYVNPALTQMIDRASSVLLHKKAIDAQDVSPVFRGVPTLLRTVYESRKPTPTSELNGIVRGEPRKFRYQALPLFDRNEQLRFILLMVEDVTEARALESQLIQSEKLASMGQLAAGVAHEIRSPLGTIFNALYDLRDIVDSENQEAREDIDIAMQEVRRVQGIINTLLDFARSGTDEPHERIDLDEILKKTLLLVSKEFATYGIEIQTHLLEDQTSIQFSENAMKQILLNLLTNAMQEMPGGGLLRISTAMDVDGQNLLLDIEDTGPGIPERILKNIFDPFFTTKAPGHGTGLGLSVVHSAVKKHLGHIEVTSRVGNGTRFRLILPLQPRYSAESEEYEDTDSSVARFFT